MPKITVYSNIRSAKAGAVIPPVSRTSIWSITDIDIPRNAITKSEKSIMAVYKKGQRRSWFIKVTDWVKLGQKEPISM